MAARLEGIVDLRSFAPRHQASRFPWDEWVDGITPTSERTLGPVWRLSVPQDFDTEPESFRRLVHAQAKRRGIKATTRLVPGDLKSLDIQFYRPEPEEPDEPGNWA